MSAKTDKFINTIAPIAVNEYLSRDKWILPSVCIAQAALESGWNLDAKTLFGIKGKGFKATTTEYYNGNKVVIEDSFRAYPDIISAVVGYYDFLRDTPRYAKALNNKDYKDTVDKLIHTVDGYPYATDPNYITKVIDIIEDYDLTYYDKRNVEGLAECRPIPGGEIKRHLYTVMFGDTLSDIAYKFDTTVEKLVKLNNIDNPDLIFAGQVLIVKESAATKEIKTGDKVKVVKAINYDNGKPFDSWFKAYDVMEVKGNRAVIGVNGVVTSAIDIRNIEKI